MYKDPSEFRERFKAYKEGKSVREIYGLPGYAGGKFSNTTKKKIDYYYKLLLAKGFDPISASGILGNALQESSLDSSRVNHLGYAGLLLNSKAIQQAIINHYGDHSELNLLRFLDDWVSGVDWIRKGPSSRHIALYSKSYLRKGYKTPEEAAYDFLKKYERAIVVDPKTKKALRDKNGEYIYQDKDKRIGYARDIYDYVTGAKPLQQLISEVGQTQPEPITAIPNATRIATTIPLEKAITYTDNRNTIGAEIDRSIWAHNVMNDIQGMSYDTPIWESKSLPALEPIELDVTPFKTYVDGKISLGHKQIPIDKARAWAMHHDADEPWYERLSKGINKDTFKNTLKYVGVGVPGISSVNRENWYKNGKLPRYEDGEVPMGTKRELTLNELLKTMLSVPHEQGMSGEDPLLSTLVGMKALRLIGDLLSERRLRQRAEVYRVYREANEQTKNATRKWKMLDADKYARQYGASVAPGVGGFLYDIFLDPIANLYTKMQSHPILGPLIPFKDGKLPGYKNGKIYIKPANRGKFNATKKRTGKTTEELTHSKNPLTRKRAIFALNAKKWNHK